MPFAGQYVQDNLVPGSGGKQAYPPYRQKYQPKRYTDFLETGGTGESWLGSQQKAPFVSDLKRVSVQQERTAAYARNVFSKHREAMVKAQSDYIKNAQSIAAKNKQNIDALSRRVNADIAKMRTYQVPWYKSPLSTMPINTPNIKGSETRLMLTRNTSLAYINKKFYQDEILREQYRAFLIHQRNSGMLRSYALRQYAVENYMKLQRTAKIGAYRSWTTLNRQTIAIGRFGVRFTNYTLRKTAGAALVAGRISIWWTIYDLIAGFFRSIIRMVRPLEKVTKKIAAAKIVKRAAQFKVRKAFTNNPSFDVNAMRATITVDTSKFEAAMRAYVQNSKKDFKDIVNQKCYWVAVNAVKMTYSADKNKIEDELNQPARQNPDYSLAEFLVITSAKRGADRLTKAQVKSKAKKLINTRKRSVNFLRSGWIPAIKTLAPVVEKRVGAALAREKGRPKGGGRPALTSISPVASAWNSIDAGFSPVAANHMQAGLQMALDKEAASMLQYVEKKMQRSAEKFNRSN